MNDDFASILAAYDYAFPPELIANAPADPRDASRLAVLDRATGEVSWATFRGIAGFLPPRAVLVLNETKVIPARLPALRASGGKTELLVLGTDGDRIRALSPKTLRGGEELSVDGGARRLTVIAREDGEWLLAPAFPIAELPALLDRAGRMPLPPYIKNSPLTEGQVRERYQTVFARSAGSVAAPTASLHFTPALLREIGEAGVTIARVTLHVHLGTFAPLTPEQWASGRLHREEYAIDPAQAAVIEQAKAEGRPIIAVGTTAVRTLESAADDAGRLTRLSGDTTLFIRESYRFRMVDGMITNFHVPKSSLLMLVCAFAGRERVLDLYRQAIEKRFRLFSFGDAMLIR